MRSTAEIVTLETCEKEPIHIPGAIQPHGVLFVCRGPELVVRQVSENAELVFGAAPDDLLGRSLLAHLDEASGLHVRALAGATSGALREANPFRLFARSGKPFDAVAHCAPPPAGEGVTSSALVLEIEPSLTMRSEHLGSFDPRLRSSVLRLQSAGDIRALTAAAAEEVRTLTGFDRVMVYRFDADWNGEVVAESKRSDLGTFMGHHYPAADIPAQARRLYTLNRLRFIADVGYRPAALVPELDLTTGAPLDMSHAILRSVSPIHLEYLRNMGVTASMSVSLVIDGVLAGLIACHHYSGPRLVPVTARDTADYLAYALSWQLRVVEGAERAGSALVARTHEAEVVRSIAIAAELLDGLDTPALMALADADGAAVVLEEGVRRIGQTPPAEELAALVSWLRQSEHDVFSTDHLGRHFPEAAAWDHVVGGIVAVAISRELSEYIIWFRPAVARVIDWAGDPHKTVSSRQGGAPRLSPRGSFELWREVIEGRCRPWQPWQIEAASSLRRVILGGVRRRAVQLRSINQRLLAVDRAKDEFIATVSHELRTPLNAINGWTMLLKRTDVDPARLKHAVEVIARNVQMQVRLVDDLLDVSRIASGKLELEVDVVDMGSLVAAAAESSALAIQAKGIVTRQTIDPVVGQIRGDALRLRQVVTNLLTNAVKFTPKGGRIDIDLHRLEADIELVVTDTGQGIEADFLPHVFEAFRQQDSSMSRRSQGLGLGLAIVKKLVELHGGRISAESAGVGLGATFRVRLPRTVFLLSNPASASREDLDRIPSSSRTSSAAIAGELVDVTILLAEDDTDSRELLAHLLESEGARVTAVGDAATALELLATTTYDIIVSDIGMPGMDGLDFLRTLRAQTAGPGRSTPAVAVTAYTRALDRTQVALAGFQAHIPKPVDAAELIAVLCGILQRPLRGRPQSRDSS